MLWRWGAVTIAVLVAGCGQHEGTSPEPRIVDSAAASPVRSAAPIWNSVAGECPTLSGPGRERIVDGLFGQKNGYDDATAYVVSCSYGNAEEPPAIFVTIDIDRMNRADPDWRDKVRTAQSAVRHSGHLLVPLPGVGDGGFVIVDPTVKGPRQPANATAWSGNAYITVDVTLDVPIRTESDLTTHLADLTGLLNDVLDDLRR